MEIKIGIIGLDSSHALEFTKILHDQNHPFHIKGAKVTAALPFPAPDLPLSYTRIDTFTKEITKCKEIQIKSSIHEVMVDSDAILLTSVDAKNRLKVFKELSLYRKPIFIDKPLALSVEEVDAMIRVCEESGTPFMSASALRYDTELTKAVKQCGTEIQGIYVYGPLPFEEGFPGYYWYGIHMVEVLITVLGVNIKKVICEKNDHFEWVVVEWDDGRTAAIRGDRTNFSQFGALIHTKQETIPVNIGEGVKPFYASLLEEIIQFFQTRKSPVSIEEMKAVIQLVDAINGSLYPNEKSNY
ncbi:gfo/Idh/MocA family oxidoreductase [Fredinandcohnia quinoae]|uniref:Gfo/Idh/MocA family oxidoreductase n=1 Tax=Fredinandcohnia quinoae TaxID=2918902 RepID=A0AAW5E3A2_9BACI|nr:gfo/Idh/MocA family oxidoreductase [Fredinandcohnia sp. SECRCQ15]MCH1624471.1 gfo/Idh/MocA family oxidoreductase [Fredinandcohnia sp. SECRCQ15]